MKKQFALIMFLCFFSFLVKAETESAIKRDPYEIHRIQYMKYENKYEIDAIYDPLEPVNRVLFQTHDVIDTALLKPAATIYNTIVPDFGREIVNNFLTNLKIFTVIPNQILQGDPDLAFESFSRLLVNATLGIFGLFDVASHENMPHHHADFGQTLATYGVPAGPYLFIPILGPSSVRDFAGTYVDYQHLDVVKHKFSKSQNMQRTIGTGISKRAYNIEFIDNIKRTSIDPYATMRSLYIQNRKTIIKGK